MTFDLASMYHVGMVVPDVEVAMDELGSTLGLTWAAIQHRELAIRYRGERVETPLTVTYSREGPIHLELIGVTPNTPWDTPNAVHHFGYWTDDLHEIVGSLTGAGMTLDGTYDDPSGLPTGFGYLLSPSGLRLEFVDATRRAGLEAWISGAAQTFPNAGEPT